MSSGYLFIGGNSDGKHVLMATEPKSYDIPIPENPSVVEQLNDLKLPEKMSVFRHERYIRRRLSCNGRIFKFYGESNLSDCEVLQMLLEGYRESEN